MTFFTHQERKVIIFFCGIILLGICISYGVKRVTPLKTIICHDPDFGKINLNTAVKDDLKSIKGIGEKLAGRILEYRIQQGTIKDIEEVRNIKGITDEKMEEIKKTVFIP
ncbi:MAG: helix-hairpin-helix domain-containing protein [Candidatus Omnitrophica bacterium]|nr:helix-hairpin-helix domain-containing protein [Candidatus Omnitrophota bacterium]